jgi:uncharacterized integral membrane protein
MRRLLFWIVIVPLGALVVLFAVANRAPVVVSFDPFSGENSALAFSLPLFLVMFASVIVGVVIGGLASLSHRYRMWRAVRRAEEEAARHKANAENERRMREAMQPEYPPLAPPSA